jgi:hypothetical protein
MSKNNEYINDAYISECCGASIIGDVIDDLGICAQCREWSGVKRDPDYKNEDAE